MTSKAVAKNTLGGIGSAKATLFYNTNNQWGVTSGVSGPVFLDDAQASVTSGAR